MKYLGIDYGAKHIGLATSDAGGVVAMPKTIINNDVHVLPYLLDLINQEQIETIVMGQSVNLDGTDNSIQDEINSFVLHMQNKINIPIVSINESFSSKQAKWGTEHLIRFNPRNTDKRPLHIKQKRIDDKAAAILLQSYMDSQS